MINQNVVNTISEVNQKISKLGVEATYANFETILTELEIKYSAIGEDVILIPYIIDSLKISIIVRLDLKIKIIRFTAFCVLFDTINDNAYKFLNDYNSNLTIGSVVIEKVNDKYIPIMNYSLFLHENKLSKQNIIETIDYFNTTLEELFSEKQLFLDIVISVIEFHEYFELLEAERALNEQDEVKGAIEN